jgi:hypothetical protein
MMVLNTRVVAFSHERAHPCSTTKCPPADTRALKTGGGQLGLDRPASGQMGLARLIQGYLAQKKTPTP